MNKKTKIVDAAQKLLQKGAYDKAIKELQKLLEEDPRDVRTLLKIGDIYAKKGDNVEATKTYRRVAEAYSEQGFFLKAVAVYKQILNREPQNLEVSLKLAELYEHLGLMQEAMVQYQIVAAILDQKGNTREWLGVLGRMVELDPDNVASRVRYAEGLSREQRTAEAVEQFSSACELLEKQSRDGDWVKVAERLVFHAPARHDTLKKLAKSYLAAGDVRRAITRLEPCYKADPRDAETLALLGRAFHGAGQTAKAVFIYKELARLHIEEGRATDARMIYQTVLEIDPADHDAAVALGAAPAQPGPQQRPTLAPRVLVPRTASSRVSGRNTVGPRDRASVSPRASVGPKARRSSSAAERAKPAIAPKVAKEIAKLITETDVYVKYGLREKALDHLKKVFELDPDSLEGYAKMKDIYLAAKDRARAADALAMMIRVHRRQGRDDEAEVVRADLAALVPGHPLSRPGDLDLDYVPAGDIDDADIDSIDIDVADDDAFGMGPAPEARSLPPNNFDTSDLSLDSGDDSHASLGDSDIIAASSTRPVSIPVVRGQAVTEESDGFSNVGTDVEALAREAEALEAEALEAEALEADAIDATMLFEAERSPVAEDAPLSADFITGAIGVVSRDSQLPEPAANQSSGDAELLSLLEGGDDALREPSEPPPADEALDPDLEEDLAGVEFLLEQGLHEEARETVLDILKKHPLNARAVAALDRAEEALGLRTGQVEHSEPTPDIPNFVEAPAAEPQVLDLDAPLPPSIPPGARRASAHLPPPDDGELQEIQDLQAIDDEPLPSDEGEAAAHGGLPPHDPTDQVPTTRPSESYETPESIEVADAELVRGYGFQQQEMYAEAMAAYENATLVPSRAAQAWEMIGICLQHQGETMGAVTAFYRALEAGAPADRAPRLKYEIGIACESQDDLDNALAWYNAAYADDPHQPHLRARIEALGGHVDPPGMSVAPPEEEPDASAHAVNGNGNYAGLDLDERLSNSDPPEGPPPARRSKISYI